MNEINCKCRFCGEPLRTTFVDLGVSPLANSYIMRENKEKAEKFYPLHAYVCEKCYLVQLDKFETPEAIFSDYAYFSSYSESWLNHASHYVKMAIDRFRLNEESKIVEIASNDGYLLQYFLENGISVLGIEPARNVAKAAIEKGVRTITEFFGQSLAAALSKDGEKADLIIGNNVLAHVPDINDFVGGMKTLLKEQGTITMEFPHLMNLIKHVQFDTIYHEHFSYFSLVAACQIFEKNGLRIYDVEKLPTHGGSLRIYACHLEAEQIKTKEPVSELLMEEEQFGIKDMKTYTVFAERVKKLKREILESIILLKNSGKSIVGYGAPAKGNTLLNYCGIKTDMIDYVVDLNPHKQGNFLPGTRIPVCHIERVKETRPDYLLILPWNLKTEIMEQMQYVREWGCQFITLIPEVQVF